MDSTRLASVPNPTVRRLSLYLRQLENFKRSGRTTISSKQLGASLGLTDAQIRKDLGHFGQFGHPGIGYRVDNLINQLKSILGTDHVWNVVLVGVGNMGRALMAYKGFERKGFHLAAVFDADSAKIGKKINQYPILPLADLPDIVRKDNVRLAILTVPADAAQVVVDRLVAAGIKGILNFAPISLDTASQVAVSTVDLALALEQLSFTASFNAGSRQAEVTA